MVYNVEKTLKEHPSKIGEAGAKEIKSAFEETKTAIADPERINAATDRLTAASHKLVEPCTNPFPRNPAHRRRLRTAEITASKATTT
jgi:hypothetical protein